jgi:hypothetical protein
LKHFKKNAAWVREFVDLHILDIYHTSTNELTSNALTKRVTAAEQQWSTADIRELQHHEVPTTHIISVPIRQRDYMELWPFIPCSSTNPWIATSYIYIKQYTQLVYSTY